MTELVPARVPLQVPVNECYKHFSRPHDLRRLPGLTVDCFAYVQASTSHTALSERFLHKVIESGSSHFLPQVGAMTIGRQDKKLNVTWGAKRLPYLAVVGCDTLGIGHGGGFVTFTAPSFHQVISHIIYFDLKIDFREDELFGQRCLRIDLGGPVYTPTCGLYKAFVLSTGLREYSTKNLKRLY